MPQKPFSDDEYRAEFAKDSSLSEKSINAKALERALDIRKFEIDLYWKRAAYFWTFIAATLAGFVAVQASSSQSKVDLTVLLANLGIVFSFGWFCVNRGSKYWQENWEKHVDMLEDPVNGPLYKVILSRGRPNGALEWASHLLTGPSPLSVSKINQLISLFVTLMWCGLLLYSLPKFDFNLSLNWYYVGITALTALVCIGFLSVGRSYSGGYWHRGAIRTSRIRNDSPPVKQAGPASTWTSSESTSTSLSGVLCLRHTMTSDRRQYAQTSKEDAESQRSRARGGVAQDPA